ncbi:MAG: DUF5318 family protein [Actinomycetota bacterium]|nr:DUF5318 family protein [Actinomycetota bacterium]
MQQRPGAIGRDVPSPGTVDYRLLRQSRLGDYRSGRLAQHEVCDAHPELRRAAEHHGRAIGEPCPICEDADLVHVTYVFGPRLPPFGRCVTSAEEMAKLSRRSGRFTAYVVEVCPECSWNHLSQVFEL